MSEQPNSGRDKGKNNNGDADALRDLKDRLFGDGDEVEEKLEQASVDFVAGLKEFMEKKGKKLDCLPTVLSGTKNREPLDVILREKLTECEADSTRDFLLEIFKIIKEYPKASQEEKGGLPATFKKLVKEYEENLEPKDEIETENRNGKTVLTAPNGARIVTQKNESGQQGAVADMIIDASKEEATKKDKFRKGDNEASRRELKKEVNSDREGVGYKKEMLERKKQFFDKWKQGAPYLKVDEGYINEVIIDNYNPGTKKARIIERRIRIPNLKAPSGDDNKERAKEEERFEVDEGRLDEIFQSREETKRSKTKLDSIVLEKRVNSAGKRDKRAFSGMAELKIELYYIPGEINKAGNFLIVAGGQQAKGLFEKINKFIKSIYEKGEYRVKRSALIPATAGEAKKPAEQDNTEKKIESEIEAESGRGELLVEEDREIEKKELSVDTEEQKQVDGNDSVDAGNKSGTVNPTHSHGEAMEHFINEQEGDTGTRVGSQVNLTGDLDNPDSDQEAEEAILSEQEGRKSSSPNTGGAVDEPNKPTTSIGVNTGATNSDNNTDEPVSPLNLEYEEGYGEITAEEAEKFEKETKNQKKEKSVSQVVPVEFEPGGDITEMEAKKFVVDERYKQLAEAQERFERAKKSAGFLRRAMVFVKLKGREGERAQAKEEYDVAKKRLATLKNQFRQAYEDYTQGIIEENRNEIEGSDGEGGFAQKAVAFLAGSKVIEARVKATKENGETVEVDDKISLIEDYNAKLRALDEVKIENTDGKTKKAFKATWDFYKKRPRWQKIALGAALAGGIAMATGGLAAGLTYGGYRALKGAGSAGVTLGLGTIFTKNLEKFKTKEQGKMRAEMAKQYENETGSIFSEIEKYNKKLKKKQRNDALKIAGAALAIGGVSNLFNEEILTAVGHWSDVAGVSGSATIDEALVTRGAATGQTAVSASGQGADETVVNDGPTDKHGGRHGKLFDEMDVARETGKWPGGSNVDVKPADADSFVDETARQADSQNIENSNQNPIKLGEGGSVWKTLNDAEQFGGDQTKIANALLDFKKEIAQKLTAGGMTPEQAKDFIKWRFEHMQADDAVSIGEDGQVKISGFDDDRMVSKYNNLADRQSVAGVSDVDKPTGADADGGMDDIVNDMDNQNRENYQEATNEADRADSQRLADQAEEVAVRRDLGETNLISNLDNLEIENNSPEWQTVKDIKVGDFLKTIPSDKTKMWELWHQDNAGGMVERLKELAGNNYELGLMSSWEIDRLQKISAMIGANGLTDAVKDMTLEEVLRKQ